MGDRYDGPRAFAGHDLYQENPDGTYTKVWEAGWHYSTVVDEAGVERLDRKLHLNNDAPGEADWFYEYAEPAHKSWAEKHGPGNPVTLNPLPEGDS